MRRSVLEMDMGRSLEGGCCGNWHLAFLGFVGLLRIGMRFERG